MTWATRTPRERGSNESSACSCVDVDVENIAAVSSPGGHCHWFFFGVRAGRGRRARRGRNQGGKETEARRKPEKRREGEGGTRGAVDGRNSAAPKRFRAAAGMKHALTRALLRGSRTADSELRLALDCLETLAHIWYHVSCTLTCPLKGFSNV